MLKLEREEKTFSRLDTPSLADAQLLERTDLQECIINSGDAFFAEIGERIFVIGKEVTPSETVQDRIDILGIDPEGAAVIVELKRGSNKLQMLQAISYAGMIARWGTDGFQSLVSTERWEQIVDFLDVDVEEMNRRQRLLLVAEGFDYALLAGAEWLSEQYGVDIRCASLSLSTDPTTGAEYLACTSIFPPPQMAEQAVARSRSRAGTSPVKWSDWDEALSEIDNEAVVAFAREELAANREHYLRRRAFRFRQDGKRRWNLHCRNKHAYVWQHGRFPGDIEFWRARLSAPETVEPKKRGTRLRFRLHNAADLQSFREAVTSSLTDQTWLGEEDGEVE